MRPRAVKEFIIYLRAHSCTQHVDVGTYNYLCVYLYIDIFILKALGRPQWRLATDNRQYNAG